jgi:hypothetical protein
MLRTVVINNKTYYLEHRSCYDCYWEIECGCYLLTQGCPRCHYVEMDKGIELFIPWMGYKLETNYINGLKRK